jgi:hypothetical protein
MTPQDEAEARARRVDAVTTALLAHREEGKALYDLQLVVGADDRDLLREARERERAAEEAAHRKRMRRWNVILGIWIALTLIATWIEAFLLGRFPPH